MKRSRVSVLLSFALAASHSVAQIATEHWVPTARGETYDGLLIGTVVDKPEPRRLISTGGEPRYVAVQHVRVLDSGVFPRGTVVEAYFDLTRDARDAVLTNEKTALEQENTMVVGSNVLLLGSKSNGSRLPVPDLFETRAPALQEYVLGKNDAPAVFGFAFFQTTQVTLPPARDPMWRMLESVARSLVGTPDANVERVRVFLGNTRLPEWNGNETKRKVDDRLSTLFSGAVANERPYRKAMVDYALNLLYYVGYADRFYRHLYESAADPAAFPNGVPLPTYWEHPGSEGGLPKDFRHDDPLRPSVWLDILKGSKSPTVAVFMLKDTEKPTDADVKEMARFLDSPDARLRYAFTQRLADWYGYGAPEGTRDTIDPSGRHQTSYPNLDADVALWKAKIKSLP